MNGQVKGTFTATPNGGGPEPTLPENDDQAVVVKASVEEAS
jgi:hypothetical protein